MHCENFCYNEKAEYVVNRKYKYNDKEINCKIYFCQKCFDLCPDSVEPDFKFEKISI